MSKIKLHPETRRDYIRKAFLFLTPRQRHHIVDCINAIPGEGKAHERRLVTEVRRLAAFYGVPYATIPRAYLFTVSQYYDTPD